MAILSSDGTYVTVEKGDTLWGIAREYGNGKSYQQLAAINDIANNRQLDERSQSVVNTGIEEMRKAGLSYSGQILLPIENRDIQATVATNGKEAVAEENNDLRGTFADTYVTTEAYALGLVDGEVGFYTAKMTDGQWLNNGFKAYQPAGESNARALVFNFDGEETGIDELKGENGNVKTVIYDLSGRRVQKAQKGLYIVNGVKVIK